MNAMPLFWRLRLLAPQAQAPAAAQPHTAAAIVRSLLTGGEAISSGEQTAEDGKDTAEAESGAASASGRPPPQPRPPSYSMKYFSNGAWDRKNDMWKVSQAVWWDLRRAEHIRMSNIAFAVERMGFYSNASVKGKKGAHKAAASKALSFLAGKTHTEPGMLESITGDELSRLLWGIAMLQTNNYLPRERHLLTQAWPWEQLDQAAVRTAHEVSAKRLAKLLWAYSKLEHRCSIEVLAALRDRCLALMPELSGWQLANVAGAMVRMEYMPGEDFLMGCTAAALIKGREEFSPWGMGMLMHCFAMCGWEPGPALMHMVDSHVIARCHDYSTRELCNMVWAFASLGHYPGQPEQLVAGEHAAPTSLGKIFEELVFRGPGALSATDVAQFLWACASLQYRPPWELMQVLLTAADTRLDDFNPQELVNMLWGVSVLEARQLPHSLLSKVANHALAKVDELTPQGLSNFVLAYVKLTALASPELLEALEKRMRESFSTFNGQDTATIMHAFSRFKHEVSPDILSRVEAFVLRNLDRLTTEETAKIMSALANMGYRPAAELLHRVYARLQHDTHFTTKEVTALREALATLADLCQEDAYVALPEMASWQGPVLPGEDHE